MPMESNASPGANAAGLAPAPIVFVSSSGEDARVFRRLLASPGQIIVNVPDLWSAVMVIEKIRPAVVVCDTEIEGEGSWRDLPELQLTHSMFSFIVVSPNPDDRLRAEVLNLGGFEVLTRPFLPEEVQWTVAGAIRQCKTA